MAVFGYAISGYCSVHYPGYQKKDGGRSCDGPFDRDKAKTLAVELTARLGIVGLSEHVWFSEHNVVPGELRDGACSAMSLRMIEICFKTGEQLIDIYPSTEKKFMGATCEDRTLQAAFNTINVVEDLDIEETSKLKVQALLAKTPYLHISSFSILDIEDKGDGTLTNLNEMIASLGSGRYFVRMILDDVGWKRESYGHSMLLEKKGTSYTVYDPEQGLMGADRVEMVSDVIIALRDQWTLSHVSFSKLQRRPFRPINRG